MNLLLQVILYGLFANCVFSILDTKSRVKRHIWRGSPVSQTLEQSRNFETKNSRSHPASLHRALTPHCASDEIGYKPHPNNCQMYISCSDGSASIDTCSEGFLFNNVTKECDFASDVVCSTTSRQNVRLHNSRPDSQLNSRPDSQPNSLHDSKQILHQHTTQITDTDKQVLLGFRCTHEGIFEHPNDCTKFIQCAHSGLYVQSCGPGTLFNPALSVCDWPKNVRCNKNANSNVLSQTSNQNSGSIRNQEGQETRPDDSVFDFDVRMTDMNSGSRNNNNNEQQHRVHSTYQNIHTQSNVRQINDSLQTQQLHSQGTVEYSRPGQRSFQLQPQTNQQYPAQSSPQYPAQGNSQYPAQGNSQYPAQGNSQYPAQGNSQYPVRGNSQYPVRGNSQYPPQGNSQYPAQGSSQYQPEGSSQYPPEGNSQYAAHGNSQNPAQGNSQYPAQGNSQYAAHGNSQYPPQTNAQYPAQTGPYASQTGVQYPNKSNQQYPSQTNPQYPPETRSQHHPQISQRPSNVSIAQQHWVYPVISENRSFQSEPNNQGFITSVQPLHNASTQQNGNVHSSPPYSKTKVYSAQQTNPQYAGIYPSLSTSSSTSHNPSYRTRQDVDQTEQPNRQSISNREYENVDRTMDLLDSYANIGNQKRYDEQDSRSNAWTNVMTVNSNKDHEIPIYNRPNNLRFSPLITDDLQPQVTESILPLSDALKLMLAPYTKSAPLKHDDVNEMTTKLLSATDNNTIAIGEVSTAFDIRTNIENDDEFVREEPVQNFNTNTEDGRLYDHRNSFAPTPTPDTETLSNFNSQTNTKSGRFPPRTNSLLNDDQNRKYNRMNQPSYQSEVIELFCTTGFDCGNGVCLSSEKMCNGRDDCGNGMDEKNCKEISYEVRLAGDGNRRNIGLIEVKVFDKWGHICDDKFGLNEANVLCREAGFPLGAVEVKSNYQLQVDVSSIIDSPKYIMDQLRCNGSEASLKECNFSGWSVDECNADETVGVVCKLPDMKCQLNYWLCDQSEECIPTAFLCDAVSDCTDGSDESAFHCNSSIQYRLGNQKPDRKEGRVEVRYKGTWGTVCDDDFGENEAKVFCRSLGYDGAAAVIKEFVEPGDGLIWLDQVSCIGNETSLDKCTHFEWGENNCNHSEDVSVRCFERELETQRLTMRERKSGFAQLNDIPRRGKSEQSEHCGQIQVLDNPDDYDDQPVFKVIEGREAKRGHHPWQATLRVRGRNGKSSHWCGAVLISQTHVLTAAHCLIGFTKNGYFIRLGDHHSEIPEDTEVEIFIEDWHIHENFRRGHLMNNDIALIKLKAPVKFTDYIQPICLPTEETEYTAGKNCSISGWGSIQYGKSTPSLQLRSANIPIMSEEICKQPSNYGSSIQSGMFCAGIPENMIDACDGDSGGPFTCQENDENGYHALYGIISWGQRCGDKHKPGVYTKVAEYLPWIQEKLAL